MSIFLTIISGVTVFVFGQIILKLFIDPAQKLKESIAEIAFILWNEHATIHNAETVKETQVKDVYRQLRTLGARLASGYQIIPFYSKLNRIFGLPPSSAIEKAAEKMFEMSNNMLGSHVDKYYRLDLCRIDICEALNINDPIKSGLSRDEG